jgi:hypothetical protein
VSGARAGSFSRIGIYSNSSEGLPSNLLVDAGDLDTSAIGFKESSINLSLNAGWYWLAGISNSLPPNIQISNTFFLRSWSSSPKSFLLDLLQLLILP